MRKAGTPVVLVVLVGVALALAGCTSNVPIPTPSPTQIVGTWTHGSDIVQLNADGTFEIAGMPKGVIEQASVPRGAAPAGPAEKVSGTWSIGSGGTDVGGAPGVRLVFQSPARIGYNTGLTLIVDNSAPLKLYVTLGRPDSGVRYNFSRT
jgi:hypothetical protein